MPRMTRTWLSIAVIALLVSAARAETEKLEAAKVTLEPPAGWKVERKPEHVSIVNPNNEIAFLILVMDGATDEQKKAALDKGDAFLKNIAKDIKWAGDWKKVQTNGMPTSANKATGTMAGKEGRIFVLAIESPARKMVVFIAALDAAKEKEYMPAMKAFIDSIKPAT
jgi:hypothetical protein